MGREEEVMKKESDDHDLASARADWEAQQRRRLDEQKRELHNKEKSKKKRKTKRTDDDVPPAERKEEDLDSELLASRLNHFRSGGGSGGGGAPPTDNPKVSSNKKATGGGAWKYVLGVCALIVAIVALRVAELNYDTSDVFLSEQERWLRNYDIIGVARHASDDEVRKGYYRKSMRVHPDKCSTPECAQEFLRLRDAYEMIITARRNKRKSMYASYSQTDNDGDDDNIRS